MVAAPPAPTTDAMDGVFLAVAVADVTRIVSLVLHSLFPSLRALARDANEESLEVLGKDEAKGIMEFLDEEWVVGGM